jgi:hypothetical protein
MYIEIEFVVFTINCTCGFLPPLVYAHRAGPQNPKINGGRGANT